MPADGDVKRPELIDELMTEHLMMHRTDDGTDDGG
jgi:hypothetical protein